MDSARAPRTDPSLQRPRTPSRDVETLLIDAADEVLRREGLAGITVRAVATEAGVAPMGVYNRFGSKDAFVDALLIRTISDFRSSVRHRGETDPYERLRNSGLRYRDWALANPAHYQAIFLARLGLGSPEVANHSLAAFGEFLDIVDYAMAAGALRKDDLTLVGQVMWNAAHGAVALELADLVLTDDAELAYTTMLETMVRGFAP
ncbi:MAG: TetR/AcrR family transcriptional regulator [Sporichthyaceae bacterium]